MKIACAPSGTPLPAGIDIGYSLFTDSSDHSVGSIGTSILTRVRRLKLNPTDRAWDFLSIALSIIGADEGCARAVSPDGWTRELDLIVAVHDVDFWNSQSKALQGALAFLTTDVWNIAFIKVKKTPDFAHPNKIHNEDCVCLLSGGLDSLIGSLDLAASGRKPLLVSQVANGDKTNQKLFAKSAAPKSLHLQLNHNVRPLGASERSQRARSLIFIAFGVLAATCLERHQKNEEVDLIIPENGFISLNVPLTPMRLASHSTRTTHPFFLSQVQRILDNCGFHLKIKNPYQFKTKGEMLSGCSNQSALIDLAGKSTSCGRYARFSFQHCGRCVPCLIRRSAFMKWGHPDTTIMYKYDQLGLPGPQYRDYDDVRSAAIAIKTVVDRGIDYWIGGALNSMQIGSVDPYRSIVQRGLAELGSFLDQAGAL